MFKDKAVANLGKNSLLMPAWIKAALAANDRIKLCLSLLQAAEQHARSPDSPLINWNSEFSKLDGEDLSWLKDLCTSAFINSDALHLKEQGKFIELLAGIICGLSVAEVAVSGRLNLSLKSLLKRAEVPYFMASAGRLPGSNPNASEAYSPPIPAAPDIALDFND